MSSLTLKGREQVLRLEAAMMAQPIEQRIELPLRHYFAGGVYAREIRIPAGTCATGTIHKTEHIAVISQGVISVMTENGVVKITAPHTMVSPAGTKRAVFAHEDTIWTTFHATEVTDPFGIERLFVVESFDELEGSQ